MNQKGEITLISSLILLALTSLVLLSALELKKTYQLLERRTHLFLCVKEAKGEVNLFLKFMGRTNWAIKNINRASLIIAFIPGLQGLALDAQKAKKYLQYAQNIRFIAYMKTLNSMRAKSCALDPRMFITPYQLGSRLLERDTEGAAILRETEWTYYYFSKPYLLSLTVKASGLEQINPKIIYKAEEKAGKLSSLLSSR